MVVVVDGGGGGGSGGSAVQCIQYYPGPVLPVVAVLSYPLAGGRRTSGERGLRRSRPVTTQLSESDHSRPEVTQRLLGI